jgi:hypothetical protein
LRARHNEAKNKQAKQTIWSSSRFGWQLRHIHFSNSKETYPVYVDTDNSLTMSRMWIIRNRSWLPLANTSVFHGFYLLRQHLSNVQKIKLTSCEMCCWSSKGFSCIKIKH